MKGANELTKEQMETINETSKTFFEDIRNLKDVNELMSYLHVAVPKWMEVIYDVVGEGGEIPDLEALVEHDSESGSARIKFSPKNAAAKEILDLIDVAASHSNAILDLFESARKSASGHTEPNTDTT